MLDQHLGRMGGHVEDALIGPLLQNQLPQMDSIALGHHHVQHQQVHSSPRLTEHVQGLGGRLCLEHAVAFLAKNTVSYPAGYSLVVYDKDGRGYAGERERQLDSWLEGSAQLPAV